jgi:hypothetical protein
LTANLVTPTKTTTLLKVLTQASGLVRLSTIVGAWAIWDAGHRYWQMTKRKAMSLVTDRCEQIDQSILGHDEKTVTNDNTRVR